MQLDADQLPGGLIVTDQANRIVLSNQTVRAWLGRDGKDLEGKPLDSLMTIASKMYFLGHVLPALQLHGRADEISLSFSTALNKAFPVLLSASCVTSERAGHQFLLLPMQRRHLIEEQLQQARKEASQAVVEKDTALRKVSALAYELEQRHAELSTMNEYLERLATSDALTGLANRRVFDREMDINLAMYHRAKHPFSLVLGDIDWFKKINDRYGHDAGDQLLKDIAQSLKNGMREIDTVLRLGGEEFGFILPDTKVKEAFIVAERKREELSLLASQYGTITMSFGVSEVQAEDNAKSLYRRADEALYHAKASGRNRVCTVDTPIGSNDQ